jgi:hypothetical protein
MSRKRTGSCGSTQTVYRTPECPRGANLGRPHPGDRGQYRLAPLPRNGDIGRTPLPAQIRQGRQVQFHRRVGAERVTAVAFLLAR